MLEWCKRFEDNAYKRVALTELANGVSISTVWLGLDHSFHGGPPLIFETMTFPDSENCERYSTEAEALAGHEEMVARMKAEMT